MFFVAVSDELEETVARFYFDVAVPRMYVADGERRTRFHLQIPIVSVCAMLLYLLFEISVLRKTARLDFEMLLARIGVQPLSRRPLCAAALDRAPPPTSTRST